MPEVMSGELASVLADVATTDVCPACIEPANRGLCHSESCRRQVLPQLKRSALQRDAHSGMYWETGKSESPAARRKRLQKERKRTRRMQTLIGGQFAPARQSKAVA